MQQQELEQSGFEIDIKSMLQYFLQKLKYIIIFVVIGALAAMLFSMYFITPSYTSSTKVYILQSNDDSKITLGNIQVSTQLTKDFEQLISSRIITDEVVSRLNLSTTSAQLSKMISVSSANDTRIVEISVSNSDPYLAKDIADCVRNVASEKAVEIMNLEDINTVEEANFPATPTSPNVKLNTVIGGILGLVLSTIVFMIVFALDDKIKTAKDVETYLNLPVLAVIPRDSAINKSGKKVVE